MNKNVQKYLDDADQYVEDLKNNPKFKDVMVGDQVFFLKPDADPSATDKDGNPLWNCGAAIVSSIENLDGQHKTLLSSDKVGKIHLKSDSW